MLSRRTGPRIPEHLFRLARCLALCLGLFALALPRAAVAVDDVPARPEAGLLWHQSGLPAVFPLQVKTAAGRDYLLTLVDTRTGDEVLAAYLRGGAFFRVLVPPGDFRLRFAYGTTWYGAQRRFGDGAETGGFELDPPLRFEVRGIGTKAGHIVDVTALAPGTGDASADATSRTVFICQTVRHLPDMLRPDAFAEDRDVLRAPGTRDPYPAPERRWDCPPYPLTCWRREITSRICD